MTAIKFSASVIALLAVAAAPVAAAASAQTTEAPPTSPPETSAPSVSPATAPAGPASSTNIVETLAASPAFSTLTQAVTQAELAATLSAAGPFTVFAPPNTAFEALPAAMRTSLMDPANNAALAGILKYHVVSGALTAAELTRQIEAGGGAASIDTVAGQRLTARIDGGTIVLTGGDGRSARVTQGDIAQSNGIVHVIDAVLVPTR